MSNKVTKLHAAYKSGFLGEDLMDTYFSFLANVIIDNQLTTIDAATISQMFTERYGFELPDGFIKQVLSVGVRNGSIVYDRGKYVAQTGLIIKYKFDSSSFDKLWMELINAYKEYCIRMGQSINDQDAEKIILKIIDETDEVVLTNETIAESTNALKYTWYSFLRELNDKNARLFNFVSAICASNIAKQALFYSSDIKDENDFSGLNIYLDSPMVFALLGMDDQERVKSYIELIRRAQSVGCNIFVLNNNIQEIEGILTNAAVWAVSDKYNIAKANNAARFFHDKTLSKEEISEFCNDIEIKLNDLGITIKNVEYDVFQDKFQEDEGILTEMVKMKYSEQKLAYAKDKEHSIQIDIRSIIMIYRMRCGQVSTRINKAKHIMLTSNNAIANVSKYFESNKSINSGHIPACISADLFAAILWLSNPVELQNYNRHRLLADCYCYLKPTPALVNRYIKSLEEARKADEIDEKRYLFLRTHSVVLDALMNVTHGDYARFSDRTYIEVYDEIQEQSRKQYYDEINAHNITKEKVKQIEKERDDYAHRIKEYEKKENERKEKSAKKLGWILTIVFCLIPYIIVLTITEIIKAKLTDQSFYNWLLIGMLVLSTIIASFIYSKGKKRCFTYARKKYGLNE